MAKARAPKEGSLTVVGTGYSVAGHVTQQTRSVLESAQRLFFLMSDPASGGWLRSLNPTAESLDDSYRVGEDGLQAAEDMTERILAPVRSGAAVCAAFYGHPAVYIHPSHAAVQRARTEGFRAVMLPAVSFEDCLIAELGVDPAINGRFLYEATDFLVRPRSFDPTSALVLLQVGAVGVTRFREGTEPNREGLRLLVQHLLRFYPADHQAVIYERSQLPFVETPPQRTRLSEVARARVSLITTLYLPPLPSPAADERMMRRLGIDRHR